MTGNKYQALSMRDRMTKEEKSVKLDLLKFCKSNLKTRYPKGFDIEKANHKDR